MEQYATTCRTGRVCKEHQRPLVWRVTLDGHLAGTGMHIFNALMRPAICRKTQMWRKHFAASKFPQLPGDLGELEWTWGTRGQNVGSGQFDQLR